MATITLRSAAEGGTGSNLSHVQLDENFRQETLAKAGDYTVLVSDNRTTIDYTAAPYTLTLPDVSTIIDATATGSDTGDFWVTIKNGATTGYIKIAPAASDTIDGVDIDLFLGPDESLTLKAGSVATDWMITSSYLTHDHRNLAINGTMQIWQDGDTKAAAGNGENLADMWGFAKVSTGVYTCSRSTTVPTAAQAGHYIPYSLKIAVTTADTPAASEVVYPYYSIEGYDAAPLGFGIAGIRYLTVSFWVRATVTGTYSASFRNSVPDRSYIAEFTVDVTNTWEKKRLIIPTDTSGTWDYTTGRGLLMGFPLGVGTDFQTTPNIWTAGNYIGTNNSPANNLATIGNTFYITAFKVEAGGIPTKYSEGSFSEELAKCQRYYEKSYEVDTAPGTVTNSGVLAFKAAGTAQNQYTTYSYAVPKRISPTITSYSSSSGDSGKARNVTDGADVSNTITGGHNMINNHALGSAPTDNAIIWTHFVADATL